jgi:hypothetical protein
MSPNAAKMTFKSAMAAFFLLTCNTPQASAQSLDYAWDFNGEKALPPGFSNELDATPDVLAFLLRQATGASAAEAATAAAQAAAPATARLPNPAALGRTAQAGETSAFLSAQHHGR